MKRALLSSLALAATTLATDPAAAQYYKGKTINMMINYGAGGNTDTEGRIFQRHLSKHLQGNPTIIVTHKPGAGGLVGINYLGSGAVKADGLTMCFCTLNVVEPLIGGPSLKVKYEDFEFIAGAHQFIVAYARTDIKPGINKPADMAKAVDVFGAGYNPSTPHDMRSKMSLELIGAKYRMVTGHRSIGAINKSILQKETNFSQSSMPAYMGQIIPNMIKTGVTIPLWYFPIIGPDGKPAKRSRELDALKVPPFADVYREAHGKDPSGPVWDALVVVNNLATAMLRAVIMPQGTPAAVADEMRKAFVAVGNDKEFQAEYLRVIKIEPELVSASEGKALLDSMKLVKPETREVLKRLAASN